jgi:hypothetical protein
MATDETWIWRDPYGETYMDAFWRNVVRHLTLGRLQRRNDLLELTVDKNVLETGDKVRVTLRVHDEELQPAVASEHPIFLRDTKGGVERRTLRGTPGEPGTFQASFTMADPGAFSFLVFRNQNPDDTVQAPALLLKKAMVVTVPGREFGMEGHIRISFAGSIKDVTEGIARIKWALDPTSPNEIYIGDKRMVRDWI